MRGVITGLVVALLSVGTVSAEWVSGYLRKDGTYVSGYYRSDRNDSPYDNYSYPGNYNPNTGRVTSGDQDAYLERYYNKSKSSTYDSDDYTVKPYGDSGSLSIYLQD